MGNSEVGHLNLGAGAVVKQDLLRIDEAIEDGSFYENEALKAALAADRVHLLGLVSDGGVHSSLDHLRALIDLAGRHNAPEVVVHAFTDGRDTAPDSGIRHIADVESWGGARTATSAGTGPSSPSTRSSRAKRSSRRSPARPPSARRTSAARRTSSSSPHSWPKRAASERATA
jgi:2,3-bisphosphoglycerate-independent phosphoglycerate mutase